jgi:hypothetical protein
MADDASVTLESGFRTVDIELEPTDDEGNPTGVDGVEWQLSDPGIGSLDVSPDNPLMATFTKSGVGTTQVVADVDAKIGEGTRLIHVIGTITTLPNEATVVKMKFGTPQA